MRDWTLYGIGPELLKSASLSYHQYLRSSARRVHGFTCAIARKILNGHMWHMVRRLPPYRTPDIKAARSRLASEVRSIRAAYIAEHGAESWRMHVRNEHEKRLANPRGIVSRDVPISI